MSKEKIEIGCFVRSKVCNSCDWFAMPDFHNGYHNRDWAREVCPSCGGDDLESVTGQYVFKYSKNIFGFYGRFSEIVGFNRKDAKVKV